MCTSGDVDLPGSTVSRSTRSLAAAGDFIQHSSMQFTTSRAALFLFALGITAEAQQPKRELRVYFVGNSVTDTVNYNALGELAKSRGHKQIHGRHMIPGSPLFLLWEASAKKNGFTESPFGYAQEALANHQW